MAYLFIYFVTKSLRTGIYRNMKVGHKMR